MHKKYVTLASDLFQCVLKNQFERLVPHYSPEVKRALPGDTLEKAWKGVLVDTGALRNITSVTPTQVLATSAVVISCECEKNPMKVTFAFNNEDRIIGLNFLPSLPVTTPEYRPPAYANKALFREESVTVGEGKWTLPGKLTIPLIPFIKHPCVVLVHGSGPHDEDETIGPNKPFKDISYGLSSNGIAVLRYVKRVRQYGQTMTPEELDNITLMEETVDDAIAAVHAAAQRTDIDAANIFVLGHSLGGYACPLIGKVAGSKVKGLILLAGGARGLEDMILDQIQYLQSRNGETDNDFVLESTRSSVKNIKDPSLSVTTPKSQLLNIPPQYWLFLRGYDPIKTAKDIAHPMLVLHADRDYQVTHEDLQKWKEVDDESRMTFKQYSNLNHLMTKFTDESSVDLTTKAVPKEYCIIGHVDGVVINDVADWVKARPMDKM